MLLSSGRTSGVNFRNSPSMVELLRSDSDDSDATKTADFAFVSNTLGRRDGFLAWSELCDIEGVDAFLRRASLFVEAGSFTGEA